MTTTIFATVEARPDAIQHVEAALRKMILPTLNEPGCIRYELFGSEQATGTFHLLETYADDDALARHHQSPHFAELLTSLANQLTRDIQISRFVSIVAE